MASARQHFRCPIWLSGLIAAVIVFSRRPDVLLHPQFWGEDGAVWYADAYNRGGLSTVLTPFAGYFQIQARLVAMVAQYLPLSLGPFIFNGVALGTEVVAACLLLSDRAATLGNDPERLLMAFLYLALPNTVEIHGNLTNTQWHLALLSLLVVLAKPTATRLGHTVDALIVTLAGLTGPFVLALSPVALALYMKERNQRRAILPVICLVCALIQAVALMTTNNGAAPREGVRAASVMLLSNILAKQVFAGSLLGRRGLGGFSFVSAAGSVFSIVIAVIGVSLVFYAFANAPLRWKLLIAFCASILAASLAYPLAPSPQWRVLESAGGIRYWFFPMLAFVFGLVWIAGNGPSPALRGVAKFLLPLMFVGIVQDWRHPRHVDLQFSSYVRAFSQAPPTTRFTIPINPEGWSMQLVKR